MDAGGQQREIEDGKRRIETLIGRGLRTFAYPYGAEDCFTPETASILERTGFCAACSTRAERVHAGSAPFALPRVAVGDWSEAEFRGFLEGWLPA